MQTRFDTAGHVYILLTLLFTVYGQLVLKWQMAGAGPLPDAAADKFVFLLRQFYMTIPRELDEAARIDGCSHWGTFTRIILPLSKPALAVVGLFQFIAVWNDFLGPLVYLHSNEEATLAVALNSFRNQFGGVTKVHLLMAASLVTMLPCVILFFAAQKQFIEGLGRGAVKG